jgi:ATP-dependent exoDNAse (exonuclease V) alpha subunit
MLDDDFTARRLFGGSRELLGELVSDSLTLLKVNDRTHGQQFKARFLRTSPPTSVEGIEKYLSSGMIRGVGPVYAKKLVRAFGEKVFDIIETTPDRLREVDGIGPVRAASILAAWTEQKAVREWATSAAGCLGRGHRRTPGLCFGRFRFAPMTGKPGSN